MWYSIDEVLAEAVEQLGAGDVDFKLSVEGGMPLLQGDPAQRIRHLMDERYPLYAEADVTVMSREVSHEIIVNEIVAELTRVLGAVAAAE